MPLGYSTVRVNVGALIIDGVDEDDQFDDVPVTGNMVLTPMLDPAKPVQVDDGGTMKIKAIAPFEVEIGLTGQISHRNRDYVTVPAPTSLTSNLSLLQWRASFNGLKYGSKAVTVPPIYFWAEPGLQVNLADHINVGPNSTALQLSRGPRGFGIGEVEADGAELVFLSEADGSPEIGRVTLPPQEAVVGADSITEAELADTAVTGPKIAQDAVTASKLANGAVARAKLSDAVLLELDGKLDEATAAASYAPVWQASTAYVSGAAVLLPNGKTGSRTANGTSRAQFDATEEALWTVASGLPSGGTAGQVPIKGTGTTVAWGTPTADDTFARRRALTQIKRALPGVLSRVSLPAAFLWQLAPLLIFRNGLRYTTTFNVAAYKPVPSKTIYQNFTVGNNANDGLTEATAVQTLQNAYNKCAANDQIVNTDRGVVIGRPGQMFGTVIRKSVSIVAKYPGEVTFAVCDALTYAAHATYPVVYTATRSNVAKTIDLNLTGGFAYTQVADAAACAATAGTWYQDGTTFGVHTLDDLAPTNTRILALLQDHSPLRVDDTSGDVTLYLEGIRIVGGQSGNLRAEKLNAGVINVYGKSCEFLWSTGPASAGDGNSVNIFGIDRAYFQKCVSAHSLKDGFNYASTNTAAVAKTKTKFIEVDCHSYDHGIGNGGASGTHNASTAHGGCQGVRIGGSYHHTNGVPVCDVQTDTQSVNYSCDSFGSLVGTNDLYDAAWGAQQAGTTMWLYDCSGFDAAFSLYVVTGSTMYANDTLFDNSQGAGTLTVVNRL